MSSEHEHLIEMVDEASKALIQNGMSWAEEVIEGDDIIASITDGRMTIVSGNIHTCSFMYHRKLNLCNSILCVVHCMLAVFCHKLYIFWNN